MSRGGLVPRVLAAIALAALACGAFADRGTATDAKAAARQVLVMLRLPPPHFRPDAGYFGGYDQAPGREARRRIAQDIAARHELAVVDSWPMPALGVDCYVMEATEAAAIGEVVDALSRDSRVESVQAMNLFHALAHDDPLFRLQPVAVAWRLDALHAVATGRNVRVAAIDSGVELDHPDLVGRVVLARDFVEGRDGPAEFHGTAVAGIIGARADDGVGIVGVAPGAALLALRACWQAGAGDTPAQCSTFTLARALQFALEQDVRVVNLSLGGPRDRLLSRLLDAARERGMVVVAAVDPTQADGGFPASFPGVVAVAADDAPESSLPTYSAPGRDIPAPLPGRRWGFVSGSSFAAAEVAGLVALLLEIAPAEKPQRIRDILRASENPAAASRLRSPIDACAAVARTAGTCVCECAVALGPRSVAAP